MRRITTILLLLIASINVSAYTYYVATNGNDSRTLVQARNIDTPWLTWQKAINEAYPGDTIFVRGGVYYLTGNNPFVNVNPDAWPTPKGRTGTRENPICFWAYPPDFEAGNHPILDCNAALETYGTNYSAFGLQSVEYWHIKGITVRNAWQRGVANRRAQGIGAALSANITFENCTSHDITGRGFYYESGAWNTWDAEYANPSNPEYAIWDSDTTYFINCDTYNICDSANNSSGDGWKAGNYYGGVMYFIGCRAWNYADDGFDPGGAGKRIFDNCWAMSTDKYIALGGIEGNGFKTGAVGEEQTPYRPAGYVFVEMTNCIAAHNFGYGFYNNLELGTDNYAKFFNNTSYHNYGGYFDVPLVVVNTRGIEMRNNVAYNNSNSSYSQVGIYNPSVYTESNNTWIATQQTGAGSWPGWVINNNYSVTNADFVSLDSSQIRGARKADWSLPDITFLKLASTSDLIDGGVDVGLPYSGAAPDLGYSEYDDGQQPVLTGYITSGGNNVYHKGLLVSIGLPATGIPVEPETPSEVIIADHTIIDRYDDIPQIYIDDVKKMWVSIAGESHSGAYRTGAQLLENQSATYAVSIVDAGTPQAYTTSNLRLSRATWGDYDYASGWIYDYGEEDFWTNTTAIARTKASLLYCKNNGPQLSAFGFGWCWDATWINGIGGSYDPVYYTRYAGSSVNGPDGNRRWGLDDGDQALTSNRLSMLSYIRAMHEYIDYCTANDISTNMIWTTGPIDNDANMAIGESGYQQYLKYEYLRNHIDSLDQAYFLDFADILSYNDANQLRTTTWTDNNGTLRTFPMIHEDNMEAWDNSYHFGSNGALRIGKALWWLLARMAGWDGN